MTGYMKIEACTKDGKEGISCEAHLEHINNMDKLQILHSVCVSLHMQPWEVMMFASLNSHGAFGKPEVVYDHSVTANVAGILEQLLQGGVLSNACRRI